MAKKDKGFLDGLLRSIAIGATIEASRVEENDKLFSDDLFDDGWRDDCEDGFEYGIAPEDYETEEEYTEALEEAKYEWREDCEDGFEYGIAPEDYETEDEYMDALEEAEEAEANADVDVVTIPVTLSVKCEPPIESAEQEHFAGTVNLPDGYEVELVRYMDKHSDFRDKLITNSSDIAYDFPKLIVVTIEKKLFDTAKAMFVGNLNKVIDKAEEVIDFTESVMHKCRNYEKYETMSFFVNELLPLVKACEDKIIQDKIVKWEKEIADYMEIDDYWKAREAQLGKPISKEPEEHLQSTDVSTDKTIYTYCGVIFPNTSYVYSYRTDDTTIKVGDTVIVPSGNGNIEVKAQVVSVGQYARSAIPYPVEKTKFILRKCEEEME